MAYGSPRHDAPPPNVQTYGRQRKPSNSARESPPHARVEIRQEGKEIQTRNRREEFVFRSNSWRTRSV